MDWPDSDLGLTDADELYARAQIAARIHVRLQISDGSFVQEKETTSQSEIDRNEFEFIDALSQEGSPW